jgi:hypothetical protein
MNVTATLTRTDDGDWRVTTTWDAPVNRPSTHGYILGNKRTAERLVAAINAQAVYIDPEIRTDVSGQTYVSAHALVMGKYANADLRSLGF